MDTQLRDLFIEKWDKYFGSAELPITFAYSSGIDGAVYREREKDRSCLISELMKVRN